MTLQRPRYAKHLALMVVSLIAIVMLAACGSDGAPSTNTSSQGGPEESGDDPDAVGQQPTCSNYDLESWRTSYSWADDELICQYAVLWECFGLPRHLHPSQHEDDFARIEWLTEEVSEEQLGECAAEVGLSDQSLSRETERAGPVLPPDPPPLLAQNSRFYAEYDSSAGFTYEVTFTVGELLDGRSAIERGFVATNCDFNEQRDAIVPWTLRLTNTTPDFDLQLNLGLSWIDPDSELAFTDTVRVDTHEGHGCGFSGGSIGSPGSSTCCNLVNPEALPPKDTVETEGAVIVEDYFGPDNPEGESQILRDAQFSFTSEPDCLSGPGTSEGWFSLVGVDLSRVRAREEWVGGDVPPC